MRTTLSAFALIALALVAAPVAAACENPDNIVIALRDVAPTVERSGEVVLELDVASKQSISLEPNVFEVDGHKIEFGREYMSFNVTRVLEGSFDGAQAIIPLGMTTCWFLTVPDGRFIVGRPSVDQQGFAYFQTRPMPAPEYHARMDREDAN